MEVDQAGEVSHPFWLKSIYYLSTMMRFVADHLYYSVVRTVLIASGFKELSE